MIMKTTHVTFSLAALVAVSAFTWAQSQRDSSGAPPKMTAEQQAMMEASQKAAAVGPNHELLQSFVGEWSYAMKAWMDPAGKPVESKGNSSFRSLMDGRYIQHEHNGTFMGKPYHGIGLLGYDNVTKQFQEHFFENVKTSQLLMLGSYDAGSKTFTFRGEMDDVAKPGNKAKIRETLRMPDPHTQILEWYETRGGKETKAMEIIYKRRT
jgi:hypothetical protein